jgi:hypothetical protein
MKPPQGGHAMLEQEARALLTRLARVRPFALQETMVPAALPSRAAQQAIEGYLAEGRRELRARIGTYIAWLNGPGRQSTLQQAQRRFVFLRLRFNVVLSHFDVFADVLTQRSEHHTGPWLAGLDVVAADALRLDTEYFESPPVVCYLDRGHGAAIRRARARLPGGGESPVGIIRIPRERMVGTGIASSLVHEVGHQGAALLDLNNTLRLALHRQGSRTGSDALAWRLWERWVSEIIADLWSIARVGVGSTTGLMATVSLPRPFVFHLNVEDPHPMPWMRVRLSCSLGAALYPDPQWQRLAELWGAFYPLDDDLAPGQRQTIALLDRTMSQFVRFLLDQRPPSLRGDSLLEAIRSDQRTPAQLRARRREWGGEFQKMRSAPPSLACAVLGQARADQSITPERESRLLGDLLTSWALGQALHPTDPAAIRPPTRRAIAAAS